MSKVQLSNKNNQPKVVIVGAGFGGIYSYLSLKRALGNSVSITLINRTNYFLFTPLLHEVATGGLGHHQVVESIRQIIHRSPDDLYVADAQTVDLKRQVVVTSLGDVKYDYLVIATGATTNFFDVPGASQYGLTLKTLNDAIVLRNRIIDAFERASKTINKAERRQLLSFGIVGGGPTGVETAAEIIGWINDGFLKFYKHTISCEDVSVHLINQSPELLRMFHDVLRHKALKRLKRLGVNVHLNIGVTEVTDQGVVTGDGKTLSLGHIVWVAGVKPLLPHFVQEVNHNQHSGRLVVDQHLRLSGYENVFAIGDAVHVTLPNGHVVPMLAQAAVRQGSSMGVLIKNSLRKKKLPIFTYRSRGELVSLGQWYAVGNVAGVTISGMFAWWVWRTVYLFNFISVSKRIKIALDWTIDIFYPRDITRA
jgi:NADH dehydrogenase